MQASPVIYFCEAFGFQEADRTYTPHPGGAAKDKRLFTFQLTNCEDIIFRGILIEPGT